MMFPATDRTRIRFGLGALDQLGLAVDEVAETAGAGRILVLSGRRGSHKPWLAKVDAAMAGRRCLNVENTVANPTPESIAPILEVARDWRAEMIVAVGGGSTLDTAKVVAALVNAGCSVEQALVQGRTCPALPVVAVPTTGGTGSEVTPYATVWEPATRLKHSFADTDLYPAAAVVDPDTLLSAPASALAVGGLDALCHAMEGAWSVNSTDESSDQGVAAAGLLATNLLPLVAEPANPVFREAVMRAATLAGLCIATGQTTVSHAVSYPLTLLYDLLHGHACALTLGALTRFNARTSESDCNDPRGSARVRAIIARLVSALGAETAEDADRVITGMIRGLGLPTYDQCSVDPVILSTEAVRYARFRNNPRAMSPAQVSDLLSRLVVPDQRKENAK
ncbi:phosphonoacetaldehyde reductase [Magnetospirillum sp. XM-1]|uniref:phosphonoacetaldehyde reductase n=1 Tax=Magnetospirillum sp. XM-1 TaxID=1663591 RepID=UPI0008395CBE|nr:phosphonoacetaldehyde reductase [Magnetospirillum sp. XM-1]